MAKRIPAVNKSRSLLSLVLALLLVTIQQFGFAHALSHLANPSSQRPTRSDTQHPAEKVCIECVAFAQIGSGLTGALPAATAPPAQFAEPLLPDRVHDPVFVPAFRSRAPPLAS